MHRFAGPATGVFCRKPLGQLMKPIIFGCLGPTLSDHERAVFAKHQPAGFILFSRNIQTPDQVSELTQSLRASVGRDDVLIGIDQEGGRVQRMTEPHWRKYPPMKLFGDCARFDIVRAETALEATVRLMSDDLRRVGINMNCAPVLDLPIEGSDDIIGDRAFSEDLRIVRELGRVVLYSMPSYGVLPVIKHMPGHGRALVDSHLELPHVKTPYQKLVETDFCPFRKLRHAPLAMSAHIVFESVDPDRPATLSPKVIQQVIRHEIGFEGLLMTDDLSMKALSGGFSERADAALRAGCDLLLHCNGDMSEMKAIAEAVPEASDILQRTIEERVRQVHIKNPRDRQELEHDFTVQMQRLKEKTEEADYWNS